MTTGSLPSTGSSEPGADEAADPASTLLLVADPATPLLVALGFPSKPLIVLLDHAERGVGRRGGRFMGRYRGVSLSSCPQKRFYRKGTRRTRKNKEQRTNTNRETGTFWAVSSVRHTSSAVSSIGGTFWAISSVGGTLWAVSSVGGAFWAVSRNAGTLLAVLRVGGTFWRYLELAVLFWRKR